MGKTKLTKDIREWANEHESLLADMKYLSGARQLANRLYDEFFDAAQTEIARLKDRAQELRLELKMAERETERLRAGVTGLLDQQNDSLPSVDGDQLSDFLNYVICIQNDLSAIKQSCNSEYYQEIAEAFQRHIVDVNSTLRAWIKDLANISEVSSAAVSVIDFVED